MRKSTKRNWLLTLSLALVVSIGSLMGTFFGGRGESVAALEGEAIIDGELQERYAVGQTITVPAAQISYDGQTFAPVETYVVTPDGVITTDNSFVADKYGVYTITYSAQKDGKVIKAEKSFSTEQFNYYVSGSKSSVEYGELFLAKQPENEEDEKITGIKASLKAGDKLIFNERIDLTKTGTETPFIRWFDYSNTKREGFKTSYHESNQIYVCITDCYDSTKTVTVLFELQANNVLYCRTWATGQDQMGLWASTAALGRNYRETFIDGVRYITHVNAYGLHYTQFRHAYSDDTGSALYYDTVEQRLYMEGARWGVPTRIMAMDYDDATLHADKVFDGFTTGEVYLSVYASDYIEDTFNIEIDTACGLSGEALKQAAVADTSAPTILIDKAGFDSVKPIVIARNSSVQVFDAQAYDVSGCVEFTTSVYYGYGTASEILMSAKDGYFKPTFVGDYTIVYRAKDSFGNIGEESITLTCLDVESVIDFNAGKIDGLTVGQKTALPACTAFSQNGEVVVSAYFQKNGQDKVEIDLSINEIQVFDAGEYTICYVYTDGIYELNYAYEVNAVTDDYVDFELPNMPFAFMKNYSYTLDNPSATLYKTSGTQALDVLVSISEDGGAYRAIDVVDFKINASNTVRFQFTAGEGVYETEEFPVVDVKNGTALNMSKYFVGDVEGVCGDEDTVYTSTKTSGDNTLSFINALSKDNFHVSFRIPTGQDNYAGVRVEIIDYDNRREVTRFDFMNEAGAMKLYYNGATEATPVGDYNFVEEKFSLTWANGWKLDNSATVFANVAQYTGAKLLLKITLLDIKGANSAIAVVKVNNQTLTNRTSDMIKPQLMVDYSIAGSKTLNSVVCIQQPSALDVLSPFYVENLKIIMTDPDGNVMTSEEGIVLDGHAMKQDVNVKLTKYGDYFVAFTYTDQNGATVDDVFSFFVVDREAPVITLEKKTVNGSVGKEIALANYKVSDNIDESGNLTVWVIVVGPNGTIYRPVNNVFTADVQGAYEVRYTCYDSCGNYSTVSYTVNVK